MIFVAFIKCETNGENSLEPLKHVKIPVGGFNVLANGTPVSYPNNIKNVFPLHYKNMDASDFEVSSNLGNTIYVGTGNTTTGGYTRGSVSNVIYDKDTGTLTASVSVSRAAGNLSQIYQAAIATWKGTINGIEI